MKVPFQRKEHQTGLNSNKFQNQSNCRVSQIGESVMDFVLSRVTIIITVLVIVIIIINKRSLEKWNQKNKLQVIML